MPGRPEGPRVGPGARSSPSSGPWFDRFTSLYTAGILAFVLAGLLVLLFALARARYPAVDSASKLAGRLVNGGPAEKVLPPGSGQLVESDAQRGRAVRDTKYYQWLAQRIQDAKQNGRDTSAAEKSLAEAGLAIQEGRFKLAEDLMSRVNFVLTEFGSGASGAPAKP